MNIDVSILILPFLTGLLVLATHVPLGSKVLSKGIVFLDLAIAQLAAFGASLASILWYEDSFVMSQLTALLVALSGTVILYWTEKHWPKQQEAFIGVLFVGIASASLLLLSSSGNGAEHLQNILGGQILWVNKTNFIRLFFCTIGILILWFWFRLSQSRFGFYVLFAVAVTCSVQIVGIYLVFSSLIIPALFSKNHLIRSWIIGAIGYAMGLFVATLYDLPASPMIVCALIFVGIILMITTWRRALGEVRDHVGQKSENIVRSHGPNSDS